MQTSPNLVTVDLDASPDAPGVALDAIASGLLDRFERAETKATFFASRTAAEQHPELLRRISECGHEVACLSTHQPAKAKPYCPSFIEELDAARDAIEQATGRRVRGHRNASFAVDHESEWTYDILVDRGMEYDSSRFPRKHADLWFAPVPRTVHVMRRWGGTLLEIPISTADVLAMRVQFGTTGSVRGLPLPVWSAVVRDRQARGEPLVMHLRASELRQSARLLRKSAPADRRALDRVSRIMRRFPFTSVMNAMPRLMQTAPVIES